MKILFVSFYSPPFNTIGAVRVGQTIEQMRKLGHEVKVLTARDQPAAEDFLFKFEESDVTRTSWLNVNAPVELALGGRKKIISRGFSLDANYLSPIKSLGRFYKSLINFPDGQIGWFLPAILAGKKILNHWQPDVIFASSSPPTSLMVASFLSRRYLIPWVAELRDLWTDNPYQEFGCIRNFIEDKLERKILSQASAFITVSDPLARILREKYNKEVAVILNGFDELPNIDSSQAIDKDVLRITHTGTVYPGKRDPTILFQAIALLGKGGTKIKVVFFGRYLGHIEALAKKYNVEQNVELHEKVSLLKSRQEQLKADVLLLLLWNSEKDRGTFTGKFFEYLSALRPILVLGMSDNVASQLVIKKRLGYVGNDPVIISKKLENWIIEKKSRGSIKHNSPAAISGYSRASQSKSLVNFLQCVLAKL